MTAAPPLGYWLAAAPRLGQGFPADVTALGAHITAAEHVLPGLTASQAALVHEECRAARLAFVEAHAERLHAMIGPGRIEHLVAGASASVPWLLGSVAPAHNRTAGSAAPAHDHAAGSAAPAHDHTIGSVAPAHDHAVGSGAPAHDHAAGSVAPAHDHAISSVAPAHDHAIGSVAPAHDRSIGSGAPAHDHAAGSVALAHDHAISSVALAHDHAVVAEGFLRVPAVARSVAAETLHPTARARALAGGLTSGPVRAGAVTVELRAGAAHLTLPGDAAPIDDLETAIDVVLLHPDARVGVVHFGRAAQWSSAPAPADVRLRRELGCVNKLTTGRKPWVAAVEGDVTGFAVYLLGAFDRVVADADACLRVPAPVDPGPRLARRLGGDLLRELAARREPVPVYAPTGRRLCHAVTDRADLAGTVAAHAAGLSGRAPVRPADAFDDDYCRRLAGLAAADPPDTPDKDSRRPAGDPPDAPDEESRRPAGPTPDERSRRPAGPTANEHSRHLTDPIADEHSHRLASAITDDHTHHPTDPITDEHSHRPASAITDDHTHHPTDPITDEHSHRPATAITDDHTHHPTDPITDERARRVASPTAGDPPDERSRCPASPTASALDAPDTSDAPHEHSARHPAAGDRPDAPGDGSRRRLAAGDGPDA